MSKTTKNEPQKAPHKPPQAGREIPLEDRLPEELQPVYLWWKANGNYAVTVLCVIVLAYCGWRYYHGSQERKALAAGRALFAPGSTASLQTIAAEYGSTAAGRYVNLILAKKFYDEGRYDEAIEAYRDFAKSNRKSPFLYIAQLGEAFSNEALDKADEAMAAYDAYLAKAAPDHFMRAEAEMGRARCMMLKGDKQAALDALEETEARHTGTVWAERAVAMRGVVERYTPRAPRKRLSFSDRLSFETEPAGDTAADETTGSEFDGVGLEILEEAKAEETPEIEEATP